MPKKRVFDVVLLSLTVAFAITKAISRFQCRDCFEPIEDNWDDYFAGM